MAINIFIIILSFTLINNAVIKETLAFPDTNSSSDVSNSSADVIRDENIVLEDKNRPQLSYPSYLGYLFMFTMLLLGVLIRTFMTWIGMTIPYRVVMFAVGGIAGLCANNFPDFKPFVNVCYMDVDLLLISFLPVLIFKTSYSVDAHSFCRSLLQIVLVGIPGSLLTAVIVGFMTYHLEDPSWTFDVALLFGIVCSPIDSLEVVAQLKTLTKGKNVSVLLLGEGLLGYVTVMIEFMAVFGYIARAMTTPSHLALYILRYFAGGALLGIVMGKIIGTILSMTYYDEVCAVTVTLAGAYLTFYIGEQFFYVSGLLATVINGILVSKTKSTIAGDVELVVSNFWTIAGHAANSLLFAMVGVMIFDKVNDVISVRQCALIFVTYTTVYCSRFMVFFAMTPLLRRVGYGLTWQQCMACVWGGLRGPLSLCLALMVLQTPNMSAAGEVFIIQTAGLVILSVLINASTMSKVLKLLGLAEISLAKKANMTNCVKRIMLTRDRCISMLKMDKFLADANWDLVQNGTTIKHPYQLQMSGRDDDSDDETYMGYHYTTCPDCEREIPNEPTKKEFAEMIREANQRVLKALKISYWRQYEHGKISKDGVRVLVQAVEVAADADDGKINLDQLGTLWKPKRYARWLRRKLVEMITPQAANAQVPREKWRQLCYRLVANVWFDGFIYIVILLNTPVIIYEVVMKTPSNTSMLVIKTLNFFFFVIYVLEMVVKMCAYGFFGYFKSHWNKLDFFIIVMATSDLALDVIDSVSSWNKWNNVNSSFITATKLLRTLRFLRLCKLARVSVPKIMSYIDHTIDIQLAFGYDFGKGFVTGAQEVCTLLPQLVDNKQIQDMLNTTLDNYRLAVTRQLGLLQRDRPWTAITVKTRQATTSTLNIMTLDAIQLKEEGFLDEMEYKMLFKAIQEKIQLCRHKGSLVAPSSPETQLRAVSWLQGNERIADFFLENSEIRNYNINDILISRGDEPKGLFILVSGFLEATYIPPDDDIDEAIPNYEFMTDLKFGEPSQDYIVSGNAVGVLGIFVVNELMEDIVLLDGICQDMATREVFQPPCYIPRTAHRLIFPKSSQLVVTASCPETKLLIVPSKDLDELDLMEDEVDDLQCELISNVSSRCLYHRVAKRVSTESRVPASRRMRGKRRRAQRRVNYRESMWGKPQTSSQMIGGTTSDKDVGAKYYKPSLVDIDERVISKQRVGEPRGSGVHYLTASNAQTVNANSEEEIYNTMLSKGARVPSKKFS